MRLQHPTDAQFKQTLMDLGNGVDQQSGPNVTVLPVTDGAIVHSVEDLIRCILPLGFHYDENSVRDRCILAAKNDHVNELNDFILHGLP